MTDVRPCKGDRRRLSPLIIIAAGTGSTAAVAATDGLLDPVVVTATRVPEPAATLPVSIDRIGATAIAIGQRQVNLSESLDEVPGVIAQERQNYAQDLQLSIRGFGARSSFGTSGVRLIADGVPGTMPDGQGQLSHFDLGSASRIEVLRGPFSALYGNAAGGVIAITTEDGRPGGFAEADAAVGSYGTERYALKGGGGGASDTYVLDASHFATDGYRDHSAVERNLLNGKVVIDLGTGASLTLVGNALDMPEAEDPLGLTRPQLAADPTQAGTNALAYNTRKALTQEQAGATYRRPMGDSTDLTATVYVGARHTTQYQAILQSAEQRRTSPGGVVDLARTYTGMDVHGAHHGVLGSGTYELTAGVSYDVLDEGRQGYLNFVGSELGVMGALRRDLLNRAYNVDEYLQAEWRPGPAWRLFAGVRNALVEISSNDHLARLGVTAETGVRYTATNPVGGISYDLAHGVVLYGTYGRGFETPTLNALAYRSTDGSLPGLNFGLRPARSDNFEAGIKVGGDTLRLTLAGFYIATQDELAIAASSGGRAVYANIDRTERRGAELGLDWAPVAGLTARVAYSYLRAVVDSRYSTCESVPCTPVLIPSGNRLPAVPANSVYAGLTWAPDAAAVTYRLETIGRSSMFVDDRNSDAAGGYWVSNLSATVEQRHGDWRITESARLDNLFNRSYVGSVIVNDSNGRFFEAEPGRTGMLMVRVYFR